MERCMGYDQELKRNGRCEGALDSPVGRVSMGRIRCRQTGRLAGASAVGNGEPANPECGGEEFEPVTVRAAVRVVQLQRAGVLPAGEARFYLHELAAMDAHAGPEAFPSLARLAQRLTAARPIAGQGVEAGRGYPVRRGASSRAARELPVLA
jgi:hypothetical protein